MKTRPTLRHLVAGVLGTVLVAALALLPATAAQANQPAAEATSSATVGSVSVAKMRLKCEALTGAALDYAVDHSYCAAGGGPAPADIRVGDCGYSYMYIANAGGGRALFTYGFGSSEGTVVYRNLRGTWYNYRTASSSGFNDTGVMASSNYDGDRERYTNTGSVLAGLTGTVTLWWGGQCELLIPTDTTTIT